MAYGDESKVLARQGDGCAFSDVGGRSQDVEQNFVGEFREGTGGQILALVAIFENLWRYSIRMGSINSQVRPTLLGNLNK
jgi:hypothetical protein